MKTSRIALGLFAFLALALLWPGSSSRPQAFHSGGVAECSGCHSMHSPKANGSFLLIGTDQSSTCLTCHLHPGDTGPSSYHIATADADMGPGVAPKQRTPGGDFGWLPEPMTTRGAPVLHGVSGAVDGLYAVGLRWLTRRSSSILHGFPVDAADVAARVRAHLG